MFNIQELDTWMNVILLHEVILMKHNYSKNYHNKKELAIAIETQTDIINRLFFSARNLTVTKALYTIENHLGNLGFDVKAEWKESSFGDPHIELIMMEKKKEHYRSLRINRHVEGEWHPERTSSVMYKLEKIESSVYSPYQLSAHVINFQQELASTSFFDMVNNLVAACNYPFNNLTMSYANKITAMVAVEDGRGTDYLSDLFTMSRDCVIYNTLRDIQHYFKDNGFKVSLSEPDLNSDESDITVSFVNPNFRFTFDISIERVKFNEFPASISPYMYAFGRIHNTVQTKTKSRVLSNYLGFIFAQAFEDKMAEFINGLNYPFNYESSAF
jgi:hypothetical protein